MSDGRPSPQSVLHVLEALEGGTARHLVDVVRHAPGTHHVVLPPHRAGGVTDTGAARAISCAGGHLHVVPMRRQPLHPANPVALAAIRALVRRLGPGVVHGHSSIGGVLARVAARGTGAGIVYTPNGLAPGRAVLAVERGLARTTDALVAVSPSEAGLLASLGLARSTRLVTIRNGIDLEGPPPGPDLRAQLGIPERAPMVGTLARLVPQKDPEGFVRAAAILARAWPDVHVVHVGDGPLRRRVAGLVAASGLAGRYHLVAAMPNAAAVLGQLDVYVLASRFEGLPYSPLEAMRAGTPVVLSDVVGNRDVVEDGVSGLLVPPQDPLALAGAVGRLLADAGLARALAGAARARLAQRFDVGDMGAALARLYAEVAGSARNAGPGGSHAHHGARESRST